MRSNKISAVLLSLTWLFHTFRAATAAITTDEAFTATEFVAQPWLTLLTSYDANHHVLHTILCKLSIGALGWGELALRLPALLGAALFLYCLWRLAGDSPQAAAGALAIAWWPELAQFLSLARGYSLALAFLAAALLAAHARRWPAMSALLGLSIAANLVFLIPAAALILATLLAERLYSELDSLTAPALAIAATFLAIPLSRATPDHFYFGEATLPASLRSILHLPGPDPLTLAALVLLPAAATWAALKLKNPLALTLALSAAAVLATRLLLHKPWPSGRTGLYFVLFAGLALIHASRNLPAATPLFAATALWCALHTSPHSYDTWLFDAQQREILHELATHHPNTPIACDPPLRHSLDFYRRLRQAPIPQPTEYAPTTPSPLYLLHDSTPLPPNTRILRRFTPSRLLLAAPAPPSPPPPTPHPNQPTASARIPSPNPA